MKRLHTFLIQIRLFKYSLLSVLLIVSAFCSMTGHEAVNPGNADIAYSNLYNNTISHTQPDGTVIEVILSGDSYFMHAKSTDGYTLIHDKSTDWICYAMKAENSDRLISSGIHYLNNTESIKMELIASGITKNLKYSKEQIQEIRQNKMDQVSSEEENTELPGIEFSALSRSTQPGEVFSGNFTHLVILVDFPDRPANISLSTIRNSYNSTTGDSIKTWVEHISNNNVSLHSYVIGYYRANYPTTHYLADNYSPAYELRNEAYQWADDNFDFSTLSRRDDGKVRNVVILYAGSIVANGWANSLWPHASGYSFVTDDGVTLSRYYMSNIGNNTPRSLGTDKHELGHSFFQWPDTYDYDGDSRGAGGFATETTLPCAPFRAKHGWIEVIDINDANRIFNLPDTANTVLKYTNPNKPEEFFMIEYMRKTSYRSSAPDEGILIWHVDTEDGNHNYNEMTLARHFDYSAEQADGLFELEYNIKSGSDGDLFHAGYRTEFNDSTLPNSLWWDGSPSGLEMSEIGSKGGTTMSVIIGEPGDSNGDDFGCDGFL